MLGVWARNLPGLNAVQTGYARAIGAVAKSSGVGSKGCQVAIVAALGESRLINYANNAVPESLKYPHDRITSDHDAIGIFFQRASIYKNVKQIMSPAGATEIFFTDLKKISNWQTSPVAVTAQKVQRSAYPDRYAKQTSLATNVCKALDVD